MKNNQQNDMVMSGIKAVAAASATPFKTAFKVTMGIAVAQLLVLAMFLGGLATVVLIAAFLLNGG
jgi:hypothetical protein